MPSPRWIVRPALPALGWWAAKYIASQRKAGWTEAEPISPTHRQKLNRFFPSPLLSETRVAQRSIPRPWFYPAARILGLRDLADLADAGAITFVDLIVCPGRLSLQTLFHELVHVAQYRALGLKRFARLYVEGFLRTGAYRTIPLEVQAYELEDRFSRDPEAKFSVMADLDERLRDGRL